MIPTRKRHQSPGIGRRHWLQKFHFMVDITSHHNALNVLLQGKENVAYTLLEAIECFENKLQVFSKDIEQGELFNYLKQHCNEKRSGFDANYFNAVLRKTKNSFGERFKQLRANKATLAFIVRPLKIKVSELNLAPFDTDAALLQISNAVNRFKKQGTVVQQIYRSDQPLGRTRKRDQI